MDLLRSLKDGDSKQLVNNFRPVEPLNVRKVTASFKVNKTTVATGRPPVTTEAGASAIISLFFVNVVCLAFLALV